MITREDILALITEEKELFAEYSKACTRYKITQDPIAIAVKDGKIELLQMLLKDADTTRN
jgi:hypothetical protein